jgi:hypothetical protein
MTTTAHGTAAGADSTATNGILTLRGRSCAVAACDAADGRLYSAAAKRTIRAARYGSGRGTAAPGDCRRQASPSTATRRRRVDGDGHAFGDAEALGMVMPFVPSRFEEG